MELKEIEKEWKTKKLTGLFVPNALAAAKKTVSSGRTQASAFKGQ